MRDTRGMDSSSDAGLGKPWLAGMTLAITTGTWRARILRPGGFVTVISLWLSTAAVLLCVGPALAQAASSFYWYGENNSTCWQTGQLGSSSSACDSVGAGYLSAGGGLKGGLAHMDEVSKHGIGEDIELPVDGDYCNYYKIGDYITSQETNNQSGYTGYTPPTPYGSYQERDGHGDACQADGANWGQEVHDEVSGNNCYNTCGMHHYVSFHEQGLNDRPWASWFGEPSLVLSTEAYAQTVAFSGESAYNGAWGYVCPVLEDTTTGDVLEYCIEAWRSKYNRAEWSVERVGTCSGAGGHNLDTLVTLFSSGTQFVTEQSGSTNTFVFEKASGLKYFTARITAADLENAINRDRQPHNESGVNGSNSGGCSRSLSTNPENYALIGVEQGIEGWHKLSALGGSSRNLQLHTEYTPLPPKATTESASGVEAAQAKLNGSVDPNGFDTHYYFQYGTATSYGSSTPESDAGSGTSGKPESYTVSGLLAGTTYHYRLVATSSTGTSYGNDETFTTSLISTPAAYVYPGGYQEVFFRGTNGAIWNWQWEPGNQLWHLTQLGGQAAGDPTAYVTGTTQVVYFRGTNGAIWNWQWEASNQLWHLTELGGQAAGDPTAYVYPGGYQEVFFRGTNGAIWKLAVGTR